MSFLRQLHKVISLDSFTKTAEENTGATKVAELKAELWTTIKNAAMSDPKGQTVGLVKIASQVSNEAMIVATTSDNLSKTANVQEQVDLDLIAISFASALAVDKTLEKQSQDKTLSKTQVEFLQKLNAESAINDLIFLAKTAAPDWLKHPVTLGALGGAAIGSGLGAWNDDEDRVRGGILGGLGGAAVGGISGLAVGQWQEAANSANAAAKAEAVSDALNNAKHEELFNQIVMSAGNHPGLTDRLMRDKDSIIQHLKTGLPGLPVDIASDFPDYGKFMPQNMQSLFPNLQGGGRNVPKQYGAKPGKLA